MEEATGRLGQGKTLAQFLQGLDRYDGASGRYYWNPAAPREKGYRTVVVDECSMLTEDQLAALLDAIEGVERLVLVGDPRQLPPIGAGRPFVDICRKLAPPEQPPIFPRLADGYAELTVIGRQRGSGRGDVLLARQFSGEALDAGADEVWDALNAGTLDHVHSVRWAGPSAVEQTLAGELVSGLKLAGVDDEAGFEQSLTDLFENPAPIEVLTGTGPKFLDKHLLHRTSRNELVRSKAELAIAEKLHAMGVPYVYEQPLVLGGKMRWPDFTIEDDASGITYYWEHLGLLSDPAYAQRWATKRKAYLAEGVQPVDSVNGAERVLIETTEVEGTGLNMLEIERLARIVLG